MTKSRTGGSCRPGGLDRGDSLFPLVAAKGRAGVFVFFGAEISFGCPLPLGGSYPAILLDAPGIRLTVSGGSGTVIRGGVNG